jgi:HK97 family phage portal protein
MSIFGRILGRFGYSRSTTSNPAQWLVDWVSGGGPSSSGVKVSEQSALKYTPFWAAVRIISGTVAELPFIVYKRLANGGKERQPGHRVYSLLHDRPNDYMDSLTFLETRQAQVLTYGNSYAEIQRDGAGRPVALWPLLPDRTQRKIRDGVPYYQVRTLTGETFELADYNVLHVKGLGFDGYTGYNVVSHHKEAIGYGQAVKEYGARFFSNDGSPGGVLQHPATLSDTAKKHLEESWNRNRAGLKQSHRMAILEEGMQWQQQGVDPKQAQALEVQKYTVDDCSRIFQMPPHLLGSMDRATFNNIEEQNLKFLAMTMLYWFRKWELECNYKLFMPSERGRLFAEILVDALLRGSIKSRYEAYNIGRNAGFLCVDDIREKENMNPLPDGKGKIFLEPLNMQEAGGGPAGGDAGGSNGEDGDSLRAHRVLIAGQFARIIGKQSNAGRGTIKPDWARRVLFDAVNAYASTRGVGAAQARAAVEALVDEIVVVHRNAPLSDADAPRLADRIIQRIGDNHAIAKT